MKPLCLLSFSILLLIQPSCRKKDNVVPAIPNTVDSVKTDSVKTVSPVFVAYTDTFYGAVFQSNDQEVLVPRGNFYFYAHHFYTLFEEVSFTSDYYPDGPMASGPIYEVFKTDTSNKYGIKPNDDRYISVRIINDSLFYSETKMHCVDEFDLKFAGKKIGKQ